MRPDTRVGTRIIQHHSKSFALASKLLPPDARAHAVSTYAWCRRADDAIDLCGADERPAALERLRSELDGIYAGEPTTDPVLAVFGATVEERAIPRRYPLDLLEGMEMDVRDQRYETMDRLLEYCYRVAGTVGLMMSHVMGLRDEQALRNAAHLGMAMQLTNICRDVAEDWERGRLYIPDAVLARFGAAGLADRLGGPFPEDARGPVAVAMSHLLDEAERYYASGDEGLPALSWRCSVAIRAARLVYSEIGTRVRAAGCDPTAGRAFVTLPGKLALVARAVAAALADLPSRPGRRSASEVAVPTSVLPFPEGVLPLGPNTRLGASG